MFDAVIRKAASLAISAILFYVPQAEVEKKMASIPSMEEKNAGFDLRGWKAEKKSSVGLGIDHYFFSYPSRDSNAPTMVFLHGFNTDGRAFVNMGALASRYRLIAYDFPWEGRCYTGEVKDFVCLLDDFFQAMGLDTVSLLGYSFGGAIAVHYAGGGGKSVVRELTLLSTTIFGATEEDRGKNRRMAEKLLPYPDYKLYYLIDKARTVAELMDSRSIAERVESDILVMKKVGWYRQVLGSLRDYDGAPFARRITCPVLAMYGTADRVIAPSASRIILRFIPHARTIVLEGKGHSAAYLDGELVAAEILSAMSR